MSTSGMVTMIAAWAVIAFFTIRFFAKVLKKPQGNEQSK